MIGDLGRDMDSIVVKALKTSSIIREPEIRQNDEVTPAWETETAVDLGLIARRIE
jgi:hypothetical protein